MEGHEPRCRVNGEQAKHDGELGGQSFAGLYVPPLEGCSPTQRTKPLIFERIPPLAFHLWSDVREEVVIALHHDGVEVVHARPLGVPQLSASLLL